MCNQGACQIFKTLETVIRAMAILRPRLARAREFSPDPTAGSVLAWLRGAGRTR